MISRMLRLTLEITNFSINVSLASEISGKYKETKSLITYEERNGKVPYWCEKILKTISFFDF